MSHIGGVAQRCKSPPDSCLAPDALGLAGREHLGAQLPLHRSTLSCIARIMAKAVWRSTRRRGSLREERETANEGLLDRDARPLEV